VVDALAARVHGGDLKEVAGSRVGPTAVLNFDVLRRARFFCLTEHGPFLHACYTASTLF
jgi:hypothetical protein